MLNDKKISQIIRVNHAGELGAKLIYDGQIAALKLKKDYKTIEIINEMKSQEEVHFKYFDEIIRKENVRPTIMQPIWKVGGFALGFITAIIDKKAAMCCTTAVEEVIDEHYLEQLNLIKNEKNILSTNQQNNINELEENILKFRQEEIHHRDIGYENNARDLKAFVPLSQFIKATTKLAIFISKRI